VADRRIKDQASCTKITNGLATMADFKQVESLARMVTDMSLCGLGQNAPNPIVSTLRYFRDEYITHITERRCRAGVCPMATQTGEP
jgi:NADH:ubiquinone oxidoreductase subunit F (NADH-binding)